MTSSTACTNAPRRLRVVTRGLRRTRGETRGLRRSRGETRGMRRARGDIPLSSDSGKHVASRDSSARGKTRALRHHSVTTEPVRSSLG